MENAEAAQPNPATPGQSPPGSGRSMPRLSAIVAEAVVPRLVEAHARGTTITGSDLRDLLRALQSPGEAPARELFQKFRDRGIPTSALWLDLLAPAAQALGRLWEEDLCDFTQVTLGVLRLHDMLRSQGWPPVRTAPGGRRVLLACAPGEQHTLGILVVAEFFRQAGWDVDVLLGEDDPLMSLRKGWYDVAAFSLGAEIHAGALRALIARARRVSMNGALGIMVGGSYFSREPGRVAEFDADACALDAREAAGLADTIVASRAAGVSGAAAALAQ